jgi:MFS family permease
MQPATYKNYLLTVLTIILTFNYLDRVALGLVFQDIKVDLQLSDTQLGFLGGISFALFYSLMGIPIARWADRANRVVIIAATAALWSVAVALCGVAGSFVQLLLIRVAVAIGEAGCTPPAFSLIADYFTRAERPRAAAIYGLGGPIAGLIGFFLAGWLNELYGWRITFMVLGAPGVALALLAWFTLKDHKRESVKLRSESTLATVQPSLREVSVTLWRNVTFRRLLACLSLMSFFTFGIFQWQPAFVIRTYGLSSGAAGIWFAVTFGVGGLLGSYLGGELASRYAARNERLQLKALAFTLIGTGLLSCCVYLAPTHQIAFSFIGLYLLAAMLLNGPFFALIQSLVPDRMRAVSVAVVYLFSNLIGMGLGPLATGVMSDALRPFVGEDSLRYALLLLTPGFFVVAWCAWLASRTVAHDLAAVQREQELHDNEFEQARLAAEYDAATAAPTAAR